MFEFSKTSRHGETGNEGIAVAMLLRRYFFFLVAFLHEPAVSSGLPAGFDLTNKKRHRAAFDFFLNLLSFQEFW